VAVERKDSEKERGRTQSVRVKGKERKGSIRATERRGRQACFFPPFPVLCAPGGGRQTESCCNSCCAASLCDESSRALPGRLLCCTPPSRFETVWDCFR